MIRNKRIHYRELPTEKQKLIGLLPAGFLRYFVSRYPRLMVVLYVFAATFVPKEMGISPAFAATPVPAAH